MDDMIYSYSRADAIKDGVLVDVTAQAKKRHFGVPVAVTEAVHKMIETIPAHRRNMESAESRLDLILASFFMAIKAYGQPTSEITAKVPIIEFQSGTPLRDPLLKLAASPGDHGELVITIMFPDED